MPTFRAGLGLALFLLVSFSGIIALAAEDHAFFADEIAAFIGQPLPAGYKAEMADISSTFSFKQPTSVFAGELVVKLEGAETADADVIVFLRGGKIVGVELTYVPDDSTELGALPFDEQLARYDYLYAHITNNYSGSDLGESLIYDDSGGLYEWRDGNVWWVLSWTPDVSLSLSFVSPAFKDEHYLDLMDRTGSNLTGQDYDDDHAGHDHDDHAGHSH